MLPIDSAQTPDEAIFNPETGQTWGEARAAFATFGTIADEATILSLGDEVEVWSFGYGDDDESFTTIDVAELRDAIAEDGWAAVNGYWGPFAVEPEDLAHRGHMAESDPDCDRCRAVYAAASPGAPAVRLAILRAAIEREDISAGELAELQGLAEHIDPTDVVLLQWAGVPEHADDDDRTPPDLDYAAEWAREVAIIALDLYADLSGLARLDPPDAARTVDAMVYHLASQGATVLQPAQRAAYRDLATGLAAATSPLRVRS